MTIFLNIALLLISATATLAAFGGKTWREGTEPVIERITARGWISLFCLLVALAVGITKEIWTQKESALKDAAAALQLSQTKSDLAEANAKLRLLDQKATLTQDRLNDANTSLSDVRTTLNSARTDLDQQSAASMVTALASARANVSDMYFVVPPTSLANTEASVRGQLLPELLDRKCDSATQLDATFSLGNNNTEAITYQPSNIEISHLYSEGGLPKTDGVGTLIMPGESHFIAQLQELLKQKTTNQMFYYVDIRTHKRNVSIAQLYDTLSRPGSEIFRECLHKSVIRVLFG